MKNRRVIFLSLAACCLLFGCGVDHDIVGNDTITNVPGGAYYASFITQTDTCKLIKQPNLNLWVDVAPQTPGVYNIAFWEFYFKHAKINNGGGMAYKTEAEYFPNVYVTESYGTIIDKKIGLDVTFSVYNETESKATRTWLCTTTFLLTGKKILDYPTL